MITFPAHGPLSCARCFPDDRNLIAPGQWRVVNDPGAWGSTNPRILVLGFSKGATQANAFRNRPFDAVPFAGARQRLTSVLQRIGVLSSNETVDQRMRADEPDFAFGSLVRCSLSRRDGEGGAYRTSGPLIKKAFQEPEALAVVRNCMQRYLAKLPERLRLVILLGNDSGYVDACFREMQRLYSTGLQRINDVAYGNDEVTWVHVTHPSPGNGHFNTWLTADGNHTAGRKRELAIAAVRDSGVHIHR